MANSLSKKKKMANNGVIHGPNIMTSVNNFVILLKTMQTLSTFDQK